MNCQKCGQKIVGPYIATGDGSSGLHIECALYSNIVDYVKPNQASSSLAGG